MNLDNKIWVILFRNYLLNLERFLLLGKVFLIAKIILFGLMNVFIGSYPKQVGLQQGI